MQPESPADSLAVAFFAKLGQIRLDSIVDDVRVARDELDVLNVQFFKHLVLVSTQCFRRCIIRCAHQQSGQGLAGSDAGLATSLAAQANDLLHYPNIE